MCDMHSSGMWLWGQQEPKNSIVSTDLAKLAPSQLLQQSHLSTELVSLPVRSKMHSLSPSKEILELPSCRQRK